VTDVIAIGAPAADLPNIAIPTGWEGIAIEYIDGVTDPNAWLDTARAQWQAAYNLSADTLRGVLLGYNSVPTGAGLTVRDALAELPDAANPRLILAVPAADVAATQTAIDANAHPIVRTFAASKAAAQAWLESHTWPVLMDPSRGGTGVRFGSGRHVPWHRCITDPVSSQWVGS